MDIKGINWKSMDPKTILIILLSIGLIISFFFGQNSHIDKHADEIKLLQEKSAKLRIENDSLIKENFKIDEYIKIVNEKINNNSNELEKTKLELNKLKNRRSENNIYVNRLSNYGVANEFSKYLDKRTQSNSSH